MMVVLSARTASLVVILTCIVVIVRNVADFHTSTSRAAAGSLASSPTVASSTSSSSSGRLRNLLQGDERQIRTLAGSLFASDIFRRAWHREHEMAHVQELHAIGRAATSHRSLQAATTLHGCKCKTA